MGFAAGLIGSRAACSATASAPAACAGALGLNLFSRGGPQIDFSNDQHGGVLQPTAGTERHPMAATGTAFAVATDAINKITNAMKLDADAAGAVTST